jgi:hypothetical protein
MDLALSSDQVAILDALDSLAKPYAAVPLHETGFALTDAKLDRELAEGGFLDVAFDPDLGVGSAAVIVERLARLPQATEAALAAIVRPLLGESSATRQRVRSSSGETLWIVRSVGTASKVATG